MQDDTYGGPWRECPVCHEISMRMVEENVYVCEREHRHTQPEWDGPTMLDEPMAAMGFRREATVVVRHETGEEAA